MAGPARSGFPARTHSRLDAFLRRHLPPEVYDAVRACERCLVGSDAERLSLQYVVLSDRLIYLAESPPRGLRRAAALRDVLAIELIDDYPQFLSPPDRETNQHIRIIHSSTVLKKECEKSKGIKKFSFPFHHASSDNKKEEINGPVSWSGKEPRNLNESSLRCHQASSTPSKDSTFCPPSDLGKLSLHGPSAFRPLPTPSRRSCPSTAAPGRAVSLPSCTTNTKEPKGLPDHRGSLSEIPFKCNENGNEFYLGNSSLAFPLQNKPNLEQKASELHLYVISTTSSIFLHLKSSWNNYIIKATLLQDPLYVSKLGSAPGSQKPYRSEEKIKHFSQLKSELFLKDNTLQKILCLITELKVAAQKNFILKRLFWKTSDLFYFLVNKLHEYLPESKDKSTLQNKSQRADELVACIEIIQTLGLMFRETETESSRLNTLAAKKGILFNLLVILISEPQIPKSCPVFDIQLVADSTLVEMSFDAELQKLIVEYTDTATALLYEILLVFQQGNLGLGSTKFAISWMMSFLQSHPSVITFVDSIVKQMVKGLSASFQLLSPSQAVLLYQQFYILKSCLQYSKTLAEYIRNEYREEFRYFIHMPALEKRLPLWYPLTQPTIQLFHEVLKLVEQKQCVKY
uniref:Chromosome 12 open reading frame 56 n=1 Tax=Canis lupus dingo TaxID=286419 RepID=A0A8C0L1M5_CANLU